MTLARRKSPPSGFSLAFFPFRMKKKEGKLLPSASIDDGGQVSTVGPRRRRGEKRIEKQREEPAREPVAPATLEGWQQ